MCFAAARFISGGRFSCGLASAYAFRSSPSVEAFTGVRHHHVLNCWPGAAAIKSDIISAQRILFAEWVAHPVVWQKESADLLITGEDDPKQVVDFSLGVLRSEVERF